MPPQVPARPPQRSPQLGRPAHGHAQPQQSARPTPPPPPTQPGQLPPAAPPWFVQGPYGPQQQPHLPAPQQRRRRDEVAALPADPHFRRAHRVQERSWIAGVCAGIAEHLGWPVGAVRVGFVALSFASFIGVILYGLLWILMPRTPKVAEAPGLESATRTNKRGTRSTPDRRRDAGTITAVAVLGVGVIWAAQATGLGVPLNWFWPLAFAGIGLSLVWRQADVEPAAGTDTSRRVTNKWLAPFVSTHGWTGIMRILVGAGMIVTAGSAVVASSVGVAQLPALLLLSGLIVGGIGLVAAPWIHRWRTDLQSAREEKLLSDARADMAAHLHDSVLQTLALIQRQSDDPKAVASLARSQERELRSWLYGDVEPDDTHLSSALTRAGQQIENERGVPIEVVCVGDAELTTDLSALVSAAREAMMNAAKHSGADKIDVYGEVEDGHVEVYIRDRGKGFDIDEIADDRQGVRGSIIGRLERHGGRARITSAPGEGTNIRLEMDL
ncbi:PspC domain-containing protein [Propionibacteriaceae bacterium G1746]